MSVAEAIALISAVAAIAAATITLANFRVARGNLALALFQQRMAVFQEVRKASSLAIVGEREFMEQIWSTAPAQGVK